MLPGFSSKNNYCKNNNDHIGGAKKSKSKKHSDLHEDDHNEFGEILLQYNLERMNEEKQYDFSHCDTHRDAYPFASSLSKNTDDDSLFDDEGHDAAAHLEEDKDEHEHQEGGGESVEIHICTYQINTSCYIPFIEYLMIFSDEKDGKKKVFEFPKFDYVSSKRKSAEKQAEEHVLKMLMHNDEHNHREDEDEHHSVIKFRGIFKPKNVSASKHESKKTKRSVYFFFQKYFKKPKHAPQFSKRDRVWWVLTSEIANFKKVMYMDIHPDVTDFFIRNPEIMRLYDCKGRPLETPTICYFGDEFQKIKYLAFFGLLKAPVKSSFGPFYVATNFLSSMKYACYTHDQQPFELYGGEKITSGKHGKYKEGGVLRMVLFVGKMKVFLRNGEPDNSQISQELAKTDKTIEKFLSLRDSNGNWTQEYDTAYKGLHFASIHDDVAVNPVEWFFKDYNHSLVISYHNVDTANIPDKFDVDYAEYKLK
jgi:hypothetical protein